MTRMLCRPSERTRNGSLKIRQGFKITSESSPGACPVDDPSKFHLGSDSTLAAWRCPKTTTTTRTTTTVMKTTKRTTTERNDSHEIMWALLTTQERMAIYDVNVVTKKITHLFGGQGTCLGARFPHSVYPNIFSQDNVFWERQIIVPLNDCRVKLRTTGLSLQGRLQCRHRRRTSRGHRALERDCRTSKSSNRCQSKSHGKYEYRLVLGEEGGKRGEVGNKQWEGLVCQR